MHTIRHYCNEGLVPNLCYDKYGNRLFNEESLNWLKAASLLRASGMPISEIKHYFNLCIEGESTIEERYHILLALKFKSEEELKLAQMRVSCISENVNHYQDIISLKYDNNNEYDDDCNPLNW